MENHYFMKPTIQSICKKQAIPGAIFFALAIFIWYVGPELAIANRLPFAHPEKRIYIITAFFLLWMLKLIFFDVQPEDKKAIPFSSETAKKLQTLQGRFQGAIQFLKKTLVSKQGRNVSLAHLPWFLLIGSTGSGKTTLLANSHINFILSKQFKQKDAAIPPSDACDWWVTRELVLVDVPGTYFTSKEKSALKNQETQLAANLLWNRLLTLVKTTPAASQLNGIVIALNLPELMKKTNSHGKNLLFYHLKKRIMELRTQFGAGLPFHFVITKCDLLPGFIEFFSESGSDELSQAFGFTMPPLQPNEKLLEIFTARFNALIKRINKQLLWRLHQERNPNMRPYIKDFPLHLERLKETVTTLLKTLAIADLNLQSVYLTSATQTPMDDTTHYTHTAASNLTHQSLHIMRAPAMPSRTYFTRQLILQNLLYTANTTFNLKQSDYNWQRRAMYAASIGIIVTAALLLGHDFQRSVEKTYALQNDLSRFQLTLQHDTSDQSRLLKALPLLDSLQQSAGHSSHLTHPERLLSFYSNRSEQTASIVYNKALQTIVAPEIKNDLEKYLQTANSKNPVFVYTALKAYLMLADPENFQAGFVANTFNKIASTPMNPEALRQLTHHIDATFGKQATDITLDQNLIEQTRKQLVNLPNNELAFLILKNMDNNNADSTISLGTNSNHPPVFVSKQVANRIPDMFIAANFQKIMEQEIDMAAKEALQGNWVLGEMAAAPNQPSPDALVTQLRNQYVANYVDIWESQLANIQPYTPKTLLQADEMIQNLMNNNSPLLQLLQTIKENTAFEPIISASPKILALNNLVSTPDLQQSSLYQVFVNLRQLHTYLQAILNGPDLKKSAFAAAVARMQHPENDPITTIHLLAEQNPEPLKSWLNTIASQSWSFILQEAGSHIQTAWQATVVPAYNEHIAKRYPFTQGSEKEVSLQQFASFLGHRGTLASFYQAYLKPFVNDSGSEWMWRSIDNQRIAFSDTLLANLQQAARMQQVFFPNGDNKLSIDFTLQPVALDPTMRTLTLNINGQQAAFQKNGKRLPRNFTWPGNYYAHGTTISFITPKSQIVSNTLKGDWGLFKLISSSTESVTPKNALMLNIAAKGHSAKYMLFTEGRTNPFLPMNMSRFELPQDILRS